ncbi:MAG: A/G-specific adenine glycosylase [Microscillaceae bacterium]|nr:A/G-specific adenine glycosylase [Microscillaceae bacterium]
MKDSDIDTFVQEIIGWYSINKRDLPWRHTQNPYYIWLSEVILQQTRVKQGLPYYEKFVNQYPNIEDLAKASEDEVLRTWQGLGYYSRGRNLHHTAKYISLELGGVFPGDYVSLLKLKGIGKYTAAAIASFAFGEQVAVVDGNVYRVLARYFGIETDIASSEGVRKFAELAQKLIPADDPGTYNQAVMEFGALQCTPQKPNCLFCPLQTTCKAFHQGKQHILPTKISKLKSRERHFHYLVLCQEGDLALKKRGADDIWGGLYDFPLLESGTAVSWETLLYENKLEAFSENLRLQQESALFKHTLTHQKILAKFYQVVVLPPGLPKEWLENQQFAFYSWEAVQNLPKPILIDNYLKKKFLIK